MTPNELKRCVIALVDQTAARLNAGPDYMPDRVREMRELVEAGEWGIALECLIDNLHDLGIRLTGKEADEVETLAEHMQIVESRRRLIADLRA